jgi:hypothetical protein
VLYNSSCFKSIRLYYWKLLCDDKCLRLKETYLDLNSWNGLRITESRIVRIIPQYCFSGSVGIIIYHSNSTEQDQEQDHSLFQWFPCKIFILKMFFFFLPGTAQHGMFPYSTPEFTSHLICHSYMIKFSNSQSSFTCNTFSFSLPYKKVALEDTPVGMVPSLYSNNTANNKVLTSIHQWLRILSL